MYSEERQQEILRRLSRNGRVVTSELVAEWGVATETVRKDLIALARLGLLERTHGGALPKQHRGFELEAPTHQDRHVEEKKRIARTAATLLAPHDTVFIGDGSTTGFVPGCVPFDLELRVVTNSLLVEQGFLEHPSVTVISTGGIIRRAPQSYVGPWPIRAISELSVDTLLLGVGGISADRGLSATDALDAQVKTAMLGVARRVVVLADESKLGVDSFHRFGGWEHVDTLITSSGAAEAVLAPFRDVVREILVV
ncbi:MAG: DeoR/GlpR family DNA-binding transcription regulator [Propionicimonas sp.]|uniref:DeoR/GlpR family DNA-binding transcription regulator n=1 Tax=Propionicimonas sp. TaxID=1955623 RepID=UPI002B21A92D|nr:DeoR/GlpR family DNA-binding transcription regulator [Propionicimonas sp.]MEA4943556.1 DeoR/GlpR family DNA-binding transcription regulator [Propionicimonas sp.]MEA5055749.1 DeoR/GlpR family DNA-binding transcription regulator [Propionicimonas sp.]MEA5116395.1 DeoR/GlpR family DNA-binding transcription regulator [Propionicimonas sp.]